MYTVLLQVEPLTKEHPFTVRTSLCIKGWIDNVCHQSANAQTPTWTKWHAYLSRRVHCQIGFCVQTCSHQQALLNMQTLQMLLLLSVCQPLQLEKNGGSSGQSLNTPSPGNPSTWMAVPTNHPLTLRGWKQEQTTVVTGLNEKLAGCQSHMILGH